MRRLLPVLLLCSGCIQYRLRPAIERTDAMEPETATVSDVLVDTFVQAPDVMDVVAEQSPPDVVMDVQAEPPPEASVDAVAETMDAAPADAGWRVVVSDERALARQGTSTGGSVFDIRCPEGMVVRGAVIESYQGQQVAAIRLKCIEVTPEGTTGNFGSSTRANGGSLAGRTIDDDQCAIGEVVVGITGSIYRGTSGTALSRLGLRCAPLLSWLENPSTTPIANLPPRGTNPSGLLSSDFSLLCPAGYLLWRTEGRIGYYFDQFQAWCVRVQR